MSRRPSWCPSIDTEAERGEERPSKKRQRAQEKRREAVFVHASVCVCSGRHALAGFFITQLPLIFNCFLCLAHSSTFHSVSRKEEEGLPSRREGGEERGRRRRDTEREERKWWFKLLPWARFDATLHQYLLYEPHFTFSISSCAPFLLISCITSPSLFFLLLSMFPFIIIGEKMKGRGNPKQSLWWKTVEFQHTRHFHHLALHPLPHSFSVSFLLSLN